MLMVAAADTDGGNPSAGPPLKRFNLDFRGPKVSRVRVDGEPATFHRRGQELIVKPSAPIGDDLAFEVKVNYRGRPRPVSNPDGTRDGWTETSDGVVALGEPQAVPTFAPVNDHPTDKATWRVKLVVPKELLGISNGVLIKNERRGGTRTTVWQEAEPMASYLAMITIGRYRIDAEPLDGADYFAAVDRSMSEAALETLRERTLKATDFMETVAGPYPFSATGGVVDPSGLGFALENQTRSYYPSMPSMDLVVHEVAHQWYGNSVSVRRWKQIWLNEGFATYMEWLYDEETGGTTTAARFAAEYERPARSSFWEVPPARPGGPGNLFADAVYDRGAMALQVLRSEIGDVDFREVLERWATENADGNVTTADLYALILDVTGSPRPDAFDAWLYDEGKPAAP